MYINPTLNSIGNSAFSGCNSLTDVWFDGTQAQWADVAKGSSWKPDAAKEHWHCTVNFNANGHGTAPAAQNIQWSNYDKATVPTPPTAAAHSFQGWFTEPPPLPRAAHSPRRSPPTPCGTSRAGPRVCSAGHSRSPPHSLPWHRSDLP